MDKKEKAYIIAAVIVAIIVICAGVYYYRSSSAATTTSGSSGVSSSSAGSSSAGSSGSSAAKPPAGAQSTGNKYVSSIPAGTSFKPGDTLTSANGTYVMRFSPTFGLEIVSVSSSGAVLSRKIVYAKPFTNFNMQTDGNAVIYNGSTVLASAGVNNDGGQALVLQGDGNLCVSNGTSNVWCFDNQGWS